jgi:hypothetical protein
MFSSAERRVRPPLKFARNQIDQNKSGPQYTILAPANATESWNRRAFNRTIILRAGDV